MSELKSLTLMDGDYTDAITTSYGYSLAMKLTIPIVKEFLDCGNIVLHVFLQTIEESRSVWSLTFKFGET